MAHFHVDGTLVVAKLKRNLIGGGVYKDVTIRDAQGQNRNIGTILALTDMKPVMVPGTRGRFYFYDVVGSKGIYGARPVGGRAHAYFPYRWDLMTFGMGALNLMMALFWFLLGGFAPFATGIGIACLVFGGMFVRTRIGGMQSYRADDPRAPSAAELRGADCCA